jgi:phospholipid/cholesterol/gamma-HCH transport system substrate-binding protein
MRNSLEVRLGIFVTLALIATFVVIEMVGGLEFFSKGIHVKANFDSVQELKVGDPVKLAGVVIGRVESVRLEGQQVEVGLKINEGVQLRTTSVATIRFTGLMGQNFVSLTFGAADGAPLLDGGTLKTETLPDIGETLAKLDSVAGGIENLTKSFSGMKIDTLLAPVTDFFKQSVDPLTKTLTNLQTITLRIEQGQGSIGQLINDRSFYDSAMATVTNLQSAGEDLRGALTDARKLLNEVNSGQGTLGLMLKDDTIYRQFTNMMVNANEAVEKVNKGGGTLGLLVNDPSLFKNANLTLQKVDKATESLEDQGVLTVLGIAVGKLF